MNEETARPKDTTSNTNAMLAWLFAPITSYVWKDHEDEFVRAHARESLYFGIAHIALWIILSILQFIYGIVLDVLFGAGLYGFSGIAIALSAVWGAVWLVFWIITTLPRLIGAFEAYSGNNWTVPYISKTLRRLIPLKLS